MRLFGCSFGYLFLCSSVRPFVRLFVCVCFYVCLCACWFVRLFERKRNEKDKTAAPKSPRILRFSERPALGERDAISLARANGNNKKYFF